MMEARVVPVVVLRPAVGSKTSPILLKALSRTINGLTNWDTCVSDEVRKLVAAKLAVARLEIFNSDQQCVLIESLCTDVASSPPVIIQWENVENFIRAISHLPAPTAPPSPFVLPDPPTLTAFKMAVLDHLRIHVPGTEPVGATAIPCTLIQFSRAVLLANRSDRWCAAVVKPAAGTTPVAKIFVPRPDKDTLDDVMQPDPGLPLLPLVSGIEDHHMGFSEFLF